MRNVTLLGFTLPNEVYEKDPAGAEGMFVQTQRFAWSVVNSLIAAGAMVTLLSCVPSLNFPRGRRLLFPGGAFSVGLTVGEVLPFVNTAFLKHATRAISCLVIGSLRLARWKTDVLLIHGVHSPYLWYGVLVRMLSRVQVVAILTDPPGVVQSYDGGLIRLLKRADIWLVKAALKWCDGTIVLSSYLAADFAPGKPSLVIDGIWDGVAAPPLVGYRPSKTFEILYAGGLSSQYGVDRLVKAVSGLSRRDVRLSLFGKGDLEPWIRSMADSDSRISVPDFVDTETLHGRYVRANVLINPRPTSEEFVRYSFPSKLIEYLSTGTPVVTTRLPTIPEDYEGHVVFADDDSAIGLADALRKVMEMTPEEVDVLATSASAFIRSTRSASAQGERIGNFLTSLKPFSQGGRQ